MTAAVTARVNKRISTYLRAFTSSVQSSEMWLLDRGRRRLVDHATSKLLERIQRFAHEHAKLRARIEASAMFAECERYARRASTRRDRGPFAGRKLCRNGMKRCPELLAFGLIVLTLGACAEGTVQYKSEQRVNQGEAWLEQQRDLVVCRVDNRDLGYDDGFESKVPWHDEYNREHLDCSGLLDLEFQTGHHFGGDSVKLAQYNRASHDDWEPDRLRAIQWMHLHPDVKECTFQHHEEKRIVVIHNCDGHLVQVTRTVVPPGTPACEQADLPACGAGSP